MTCIHPVNPKLRDMAENTHGLEFSVTCGFGAGAGIQSNGAEKVVRTDAKQQGEH
jgi:hypothetical protein